jgi:hypothetical protein
LLVSAINSDLSKKIELLIRVEVELLVKRRKGAVITKGMLKGKNIEFRI